MGWTRQFALVQPRASFTLTGRHSPRQSSRRTRANAVGIRSLSVFWKNRKWCGAIFHAAVPEPFAMVDGRMVDGARGWLRLTSRLRTADPETLRDGRWSEGRRSEGSDRERRWGPRQLL